MKIMRRDDLVRVLRLTDHKNTYSLDDLAQLLDRFGDEWEIVCGNRVEVRENTLMEVWRNVHLPR